MNKKYYYNNCTLVNTAAALTTYKMQNPFTPTPMAECYKMMARVGAHEDSKREKHLYLVTARYLGWNIKRRGAAILENGIEIWRTDGD